MSPATRDTWRAFRAAPSERTFEALYEETNRLIYTICMRILRNPDDAADAFQSAYARLLQQAHAAPPDSDPEDARALAARLAVREAENLRKRRGRRGRREVAMEDLTILTDLTDPAGAQSSPYEAAAQHEVRSKVEALIALLPDRYRLPLLLHYFDGMKQAEIALALGTSEGSVRGCIARGLKKLRPLLHRAGLGESAAALGAIALTGHLLSPPASCSAALVFAKASASLTAGGGATATSGSGTTASSQTLLGAGLSAKIALAVAAALVVAATAFLVPKVLDLSGDRAASRRASSAVQGLAGEADSRDAASGRGTGAGLGAGREAASARDSSASAPRAANSLARTTANLRPTTYSLTAQTQTTPKGSGFGTLYGKVSTNESGQPAAGARVWIPGTALEAKTGPKGEFEIAQVPAGAALRLAAEAPPLRSYDQESEIPPLTLEPGERRRCDAVLHLNPIVTGKVRDLDLGEGITSATLMIDNQTVVTTDATGTYRIEGLKPEDYGHSLRVTAAGYVQTRVLAHPSAGEDTLLNFDLERGVGVDVRVVDEKNVPVAEAIVTVWQPGDNSPGTYDLIEGNDTTDQSGRCRVEAIGRRHPAKLLAKKEGNGKSDLLAPQFGHDGTAPELLLVLKPEDKNVKEGRITGTITDRSGAPVAGVDVRYWSGGGDFDEKAKATTGEDGKYSLATPTSDNREGALLVTRKGWAPASKNNVSPGTMEQPAQADFTLEPGHWLSGTVVDGDGLPLEGVSASLWTMIEGGHRGFVTSFNALGLDDTFVRTGAEGRFELLDLPADSAQIHFRKEKFADLESVHNVDQDVRVALSPLGVIRGVVRSKESGEALPEFFVQLIAGNGQNQRPTGTKEAFSAADGRFVLKNQDSGPAFALRVEAPGFAAAVVQAIHAAPEEKAAEIEIALSKAVITHGVVVDGVTGQGLANVRVVCGWPQKSMVFNWGSLERDDSFGLRDSRRAVTGPDGSFDTDEGDGTGNLYVRASGRQPVIVAPEARAKYAANDGTLRIVLEAGGSVSGVYLKGGAPVAQASMQLYTAPLGSGPGMGWVKTDDAGRYRWDGLPAGDYQLQVSDSELERVFSLGAKEDKIINLGGDLGEFALFGRVTDRAGAPVNDITIEMTPQFDWEYGPLRATSDAQGNYRLEGLRAGHYTLTVVALHAGAFAQIKTELEIGADLQRDFALERRNRLTATLVFPDTVPMARRANYTSAYLRRTSETDPANGGPTGEIDAYSYGSVRAGGLAFGGRFQGEYVLTIQFQDGERSSDIVLPQAVQLDNLNGDQDLGDIAMPAEGRVRVTFDFSPPPSDLPGAANSALLLLAPNGPDLPFGGNHISSSLPQGQTEQTLGPFATGSYGWTIQARGYRCDPEQGTVVVQAGETVSVVAVLRPEGLVMGTVQSATGRTVTPRSVRIAGPGTDRVLVPQPKQEGAPDASGFEDYQDSLAGNRFRFHSLPEGTYDLTVEADGYETWHGQRTVVPGVYDSRATTIRLPAAKR